MNLPIAKLDQVQGETSNRGPDFFTGATLSINEICKAAGAIARAARDLRIAQAEANSLADTKAACEQIAEHAHNAHYLAQALAKTVTTLQNRKPRA
jgi:hypothetical protein